MHLLLEFPFYTDIKGELIKVNIIHETLFFPLLWTKEARKHPQRLAGQEGFGGIDVTTYSSNSSSLISAAELG